MRIQIKDQDTLSNLSSTRVSQAYSANVSPRASIDICSAAEILHQNYKKSQQRQKLTNLRLMLIKIQNKKIIKKGENEKLVVHE